MMIWQVIAVSLKSLAANKLRSLLTYSLHVPDAINSTVRSFNVKIWKTDSSL